MLILGFPDYAKQANALADGIGAAYHEVVLHRFPDGESRITLPAELPEHVVVCRSLDQPNDKLVELLLCADTMRQQGVQRLSLVAPYLCYMRQDSAFHAGEAISQRIIGRFLGRLFDDIVTVDPHLHRIERLEQAIPNSHAIAVSATKLLGDYLQTRWHDPLLVGPDSESEQWVSVIAEARKLPFAIANKERFGDWDVEISVPAVEVKQRTVVLIDDIASTAQTLIGAAAQLQRLGVASMHALITHALFDAQALARMQAVGIDFVGSTDSITHESNVINLAPLLAEAVRRL